MKNVKKVLAIVLIFVLLCLVFVACDKASVGVDGEQPEVLPNGRKPFAKPDPNNKMDLLKESERGDYSKTEFEGKKIYLALTNSESLNNIFYDYTPEDFGSDRFSSVADSFPESLEKIRNQIRDGKDYDINSKNMVNPKTYARTLELGLINQGRQSALDCIEYLYRKQYVRRASPDVQGKITWFATANDPSIGEQWALSKIKVFDAWDTTIGSSGVTVGLIDSGIKTAHEDLSVNISTLSCGADPFVDSVNHGTLTAGVLGAVGNNMKGISGVCQSVKIASLKACIGNNQEDPRLVINAINYAEQNNIKLLNFSGGFYQNQLAGLSEAFYSAISSYNGLLVVAAGNESSNIDNGTLYPQCFNLDNILVVGSTNQNDGKSSYSNYGKTNVDLFAPGDGIYTTSNGSNSSYTSASGTSLSAPFVAGVVALIMSVEPNISASSLKNRIMDNVDTIPALAQSCVSGGRLNAEKALEYAVHPHDKSTLVYINLGLHSGHRVECQVCDYCEEFSHAWVGNEQTKYRCLSCGAYTKYVPIRPNPDDFLMLNDLFEKETISVGGVKMIAVSDDVAIVQENGEFYLIVACDENGKIANDIIEDIKIPWLKDLIANEVSKVKDEKN